MLVPDRDAEMGVVEAGSGAEDCPVPIQEQADEIFDGDPLHWDTYAGRPVVAVLIVVV